MKTTHRVKTPQERIAERLEGEKYRLLRAANDIDTCNWNINHEYFETVVNAIARDIVADLLVEDVA